MTKFRTYQERVDDWMQQCFGPEISADTTERNHRFLEEALELVQSLGCTASEAHQLVDYTFGRPIGEPAQEVGGVAVTLAALCNAAGLDIAGCGENELTRISAPTTIEKIRAKQAAKPKHSPLPEAPQPPAADALVERIIPEIRKAREDWISRECLGRTGHHDPYADAHSIDIAIAKAVAPYLQSDPTRIVELEARVKALEEHIREQVTHVETRIQDGIEIGATVWRIALEDVARENRAALGEG